MPLVYYAEILCDTGRLTEELLANRERVAVHDDVNTLHMIDEDSNMVSSRMMAQPPPEDRKVQLYRIHQILHRNTLACP